MRSNKLTRPTASLTALALLAGALGVAASPAPIGGPWELNGPATEATTSATTAIDQSIQLRVTLSAQGEAQSGTVQFGGGLSRDLTHGEAALYWETFNGPQTFWDRMKTAGRVDIWTPSAGALPAGMVGKTVRLFAVSGHSYIGVLGRGAGGGNEQLIMHIEGNQIPIETAQVREVDVLKKD